MRTKHEKNDKKKIGTYYFFSRSKTINVLQLTGSETNFSCSM